MIRTLLVLAIATLFPTQSRAQSTAPDVEGSWTGLLRVPGAPAAITVDVRRGPSGWGATVSVPGHGVQEMPFEQVIIAGDSVRLVLPGRLELRGRLDPAGAILRGSASAGPTTFPFALARAGSPEAHQLGSDAGIPAMPGQGAEPDAAGRDGAAAGVAAGSAGAAAQVAPGVEEVLLDGCVRVHHVWKLQDAAVRRTAGRPARERTAAMVEDAYRPYADFWNGYIGDEAGFRRWAGDWARRATDPRLAIPSGIDPGAMIEETTRRVAELTGRPRACSDWYLVYGPGWTNLGGIRNTGMVVDFLGFAPSADARELAIYLPHELNHLVFGPSHWRDPDAGTLLDRIIDEGFATYFSVLYRDGELTPAGALGYTEAEWRWALEHERELWGLAEPLLRSRDAATIQRFRAVRERVRRGAPGKIGYFLGYRIVEAYVARHGEGSWRDLYDLPYARILEESGYSPAGSVVVRTTSDVGPLGGPGVPLTASHASPRSLSRTPLESNRAGLRSTQYPALPDPVPCSATSGQACPGSHASVPLGVAGARRGSRWSDRARCRF
jgi:hypothetical protein